MSHRRRQLIPPATIKVNRQGAMRTCNRGAITFNHHPITSSILDLKMLQGIIARIGHQLATGRGATTATTLRQGRLPHHTKGIIAGRMTVSNIHLRLGISLQSNGYSCCRTVPIRISNGVFKANLTFLTISRPIGKGTVFVVGQIASTTQAALHHLHTSHQVNTIGSALVIGKDINVYRLILSSLCHLIIYGLRTIIINSNDQIHLRRDISITIYGTYLKAVLNLVICTSLASITMSHRRRQLIRPATIKVNRQGAMRTGNRGAITFNHHPVAICIQNLKVLQLIIARISHQLATGRGATTTTTLRQGRLPNYTCIISSIANLYHRLGISLQSNGYSCCRTVPIRIGNGVLKANLTFLTISRRIGKGTVFVVDQRALATQTAVHYFDACLQVNTIGTALVIGKDIDVYRLILSSLRYLIIYGLRTIIINLND